MNFKVFTFLLLLMILYGCATHVIGLRKSPSFTFNNIQNGNEDKARSVITKTASTTASTSFQIVDS